MTDSKFILRLLHMVEIKPQSQRCHVKGACTNYSANKHLNVYVMSSMYCIFQDYKNTTKLTWLAVTDSAPLLPTITVYYDNIIAKAILTKNDDFKEHVNKNTKVSTVCQILKNRSEYFFFLMKKSSLGFWRHGSALRWLAC